MKKLLFTTLSTVLALSLLCGCTVNINVNNQSKETTSASTTEVEQTTENQSEPESSVTDQTTEVTTEQGEPFAEELTEAALNRLKTIQVVNDGINEGMSILVTGEYPEIYGEICVEIAMGTNHEDNFVREDYFAVSTTGAVYRYYVDEDIWRSVNALAAVYEVTYEEDTLFAIVTEDNVIDYNYLLETSDVIEVSTPAVSQFGANVVLMLPLRDDVDFEFKLLNSTFESEEFTYDEVCHTIDGAKRGEVYAVSVTLAETIAALMIEGTNDGLTAQWYAAIDGRGESNGIYAIRCESN